MASPTVGRSGGTIVGGIEGGEAPTRVDMNDNLTADIIYETRRRYAGYKDIVQLSVQAIWSNYLTEETIEMDRLIECIDANEDAMDYGWAAVVVDARTQPPRCERWHPEIDGTGFSVTKTSKRGFPLEIQIQARFNESSVPMRYPVKHYPCEVMTMGEGKNKSLEYIRDNPIPGKHGFFIVRTRGGKKGIRGLPQYLQLIMLIRKTYDIIENYCTYAESQALALAAVGLERNTPENRASVKAQYTNQPTHRKLLIVGKEDWADWISPMNSAWDPWAMLEYIDKLIARATQMNKLMLTGEFAGHLGASETAINNWEAKVMEQQAYWLGQFRPIFIALGATKDVAFKDPSKPAFISLMEGLKAAREAMEGIISMDDIVMLFNTYLQKHGRTEVLHVAPPEERATYDQGPTASEENSQEERAKT